jgi:uncharacterized protein YutE (UPF0331/DUF86 family)
VLDEGVVLARLDGLRTVLLELRELLPEEPGALTLLEERITRRAVERCLYLAIQHLLDIGAHIVAAEGWGLPGSYREVIEKLGVLPPEFARLIAPMAGFRNILEHDYVELDLRELDANARRFDDFDRFAGYVVAYLDRS